MNPDWEDYEPVVSRNITKSPVKTQQENINPKKKVVMQIADEPIPERIQKVENSGTILRTAEAAAEANLSNLEADSNFGTKFFVFSKKQFEF